jgi:hypothetical protein
VILASGIARGIKLFGWDSDCVGYRYPLPGTGSLNRAAFFEHTLEPAVRTASFVIHEVKVLHLAAKA